MFTRFSTISLLLLCFSSDTIAQDNLNTLAEPLIESHIADSKLNSVSVDNMQLSHLQPKIQDQSAKVKLKSLLSAMAFLSADFLQKVFDEEGSDLQQNQGRLVVSKPNLVRWHTQSPDESLIVSDGKVLWLYDPFIEQASVYTLDAAIANTPILLLSNDDDKLWDKYTVSQVAPLTFQIHANDTNSRIIRLELRFTPSAIENNHSLILTSLSLMDTTGQLSVIKLTNIDNTSRPAVDLFKFVLPEGVYLDDQR